MPETSPNPPDHAVLLKAAPSVSIGTLIVVILLTAILAVMVADRLRGPAAPVAPAAPVDSHFVAIGKTIEPRMGPTYAGAWLAFAQALDGGQPLSAALKALEDDWAAGRLKLAGPLLAELAKIVPAGTPDAGVTPSQKAAASAAARGIAHGLSKGNGFHLFPLSLPEPVTPDVPRRTLAAATFEGRAELIARTLPAIEPSTPPVRRSMETTRAMPPILPVEPATGPAMNPAWHWRYFLADPRVEAWGYLADDGVFYYRETRWRHP